MATFLTASLPTRVFAETVGGSFAPEITDDQCFITLRHANGSLSYVAYLSGGDKSFPKERIEVIGGGKLAVIDDYRQVLLTCNGKVKKYKQRFDKGHRAEVQAFASAVKNTGEAPIPWPELSSVSLASILAVQSIREGLPLEVTQHSRSEFDTKMGTNRLDPLN